MELLRVTTILREPFVMKRNGKYVGPIFEFLDVLAAKFRLNYTVSIPRDGQWGRKVNGTFTGMMGMLVNNEADMAASSISVSADRQEAADFLAPFHEEPSVIVLPPSARINVKQFSLHRPFQPEVWAALVVCILMEIMVVSFILKMIHRSVKFSDNVLRAANLSLCTLLNQDCCDDRIERDSLRMSLSLYWIVTFVLNQAYMSLMVAFLLAPTDSVTIRGISDLIKQDKMKWTYQAGTVHESLFDPNGLAAGDYRQIGLRASSLVADPEEGFARVHAENIAFLKDKSRVEFEVATVCEEEGKRLIIAAEDFYPVGFAIGLRKEHPHYEAFNLFMLTCQHVGLWYHWKSMYWKDVVKCCGPIDEKVRQERSRILVELDDLEYIYYFYFALQSACLAGLVIELFVFFLCVYLHRRTFESRCLLMQNSQVIQYPITSMRYYQQIMRSSRVAHNHSQH